VSVVTEKPEGVLMDGCSTCLFGWMRCREELLIIPSTEFPGLKTPTAVLLTVRRYCSDLKKKKGDTVLV
jgi:hypothetical protein